MQRSYRWVCRGILLLVLMGFGLSIYAQDTAVQEKPQTAEHIVRSLYEMVSWDPGKPPDWEVVKTLFVEDAVVVLRTGRESMQSIDRQGFVDLFLQDIERYNLDERGFQEKIISLKGREFGNIAHFFVVYEVSVPGDQRPPMRGLDTFHLWKRDGSWEIVSILNELPMPGNPIPEDLLQ